MIGMELVKYFFDIPLSLNILTAGEKYISIEIKKHCSKDANCMYRLCFELSFKSLQYETNMQKKISRFLKSCRKICYTSN